MPGLTRRLATILIVGQVFERLPKRWMAERPFGWLNRFRRLSKDYELYPEVSEFMIYSALIRLLVKRLTA